jgi:hypothetical protein
MDELYKGRHIYAAAELNLDADCWIPIADISWYEQGNLCHHHLVGPTDFFKVIEDAHSHAVEIAKTWIDVQTMRNAKVVKDVSLAVL